MEQRDHINPNDDIARMIEEIGAARKPLMISGHMPFLGRLAARLLFGDEKKEIVDMANASPLILVKKEEGWVVDTYIKNDYIR